MMSKALRMATLAAALLGASAAGVAYKTKTAQLCVDTGNGYYTSYDGTGTDDPSTFAVNVVVADCSSYDAVNNVFDRPLGEFAFNCVWADYGPADQLIPCDGVLTVQSASKAKARLSTAKLHFWIPKDKLLAGAAVLNPGPLVDPIVTHTTGSWPKNEETITSFGWAQDAVAPNLVRLNINYKANGWNPVSTK